MELERTSLFVLVIKSRNAFMQACVLSNGSVFSKVAQAIQSVGNARVFIHGFNMERLLESNIR